MRIGIPKELHDGEKRVATTPEVATQLQKLGFTVAIESGAGAAANFTDAAYAAAGVTIVPTARVDPPPRYASLILAIATP